MKRPTFIVIGASRSGTTSLHYYLQQHPQIYMSPKKSPNYFASHIKQPVWENDIVLSMAKQWIATEKDYLQLFAHVCAEKAIGEVSPVYLQAIDIPKRIAKYCPNIKIIAVLRNPVIRAYTHFIGRKRDGLEKRNCFDDVIQDELVTELPLEVAFGHYLGCGFYYYFLKEYYELFPKENIKIYTFENFIKDPQSILIDIYDFLGVDVNFKANTQISHNKTGIIDHSLLRFLWTQSVKLRTYLRPYIPLKWRNLVFRMLLAKNIKKPQISHDVYKQLQDIYAMDIQSLQKLIDQDLSHWQ